MNTQKFFLKIDAESPDGVLVKCETQLSVDCSSSMAIAVMANLLKDDKNFCKILKQAFYLIMENKEFTQEVSNKEFENRYKDKEDNIEF